MRLFLKNQSRRTIIFKTTDTEITLFPDFEKQIEAPDSNVEFMVYADENYRCEPITSKLGLSYFHRFIIMSTYCVKLTGDTTISFYCETAQGNNLESYSRIYPHSTDCTPTLSRYAVKDEEKIKGKISKSDKNEAVILQGAGVAGKLIKAKNTVDDIITAAILGIIALIVFILIWIFKSFKIAFTVYTAIAVIALLTWKLFLEKTIEKVKSKAKTKAEAKAEKIFLPCENMPEGIFKSKDSYFEHDYICAVFKHSTKRQ